MNIPRIVARQKNASYEIRRKRIIREKHVQGEDFEEQRNIAGT